MLVAGGFLAFAWSIDQDEHPPSRKAEAMIALTGGKDRIPDAVTLLAEGYANRLLISGDLHVFGVFPRRNHRSINITQSRANSHGQNTSQRCTYYPGQRFQRAKTLR